MIRRDRPARALADARFGVFRLEDPARPGPLPRLRGPESADLIAVGGGHADLWAGLQAKDRNPSLDVVVVDLDVDVGPRRPE